MSLSNNVSVSLLEKNNTLTYKYLQSYNNINSYQ